MRLQYIEIVDDKVPHVSIDTPNGYRKHSVQVGIGIFEKSSKVTEGEYTSKKPRLNSSTNQPIEHGVGFAETSTGPPEDQSQSN